jgi:hypothetical protein
MLSDLNIHYQCLKWLYGLQAMNIICEMMLDLWTETNISSTERNKIEL